MSAPKHNKELLERARKHLKLKDFEALFRSARDDSPDAANMTATLKSELRQYVMNDECPQYVLDFCEKTVAKMKRAKAPHDNITSLNARLQPDRVVDLSKRRSRRNQT